MFHLCIFCHGAQAQGGPALDALALAGQVCVVYRKAVKGISKLYSRNYRDDVLGLQMTIVFGAVRNKAAIKNISELYLACLLAAS